MEVEFVDSGVYLTKEGLRSQNSPVLDLTNEKCRDFLNAHEITWMEGEEEHNQNYMSYSKIGTGIVGRNNVKKFDMLKIGLHKLNKLNE